MAMNGKNPLRLYVLDTGLIECADFAIFSPTAGAGEYRELSVRSYLIVHPKGIGLGAAVWLHHDLDAQRVVRTSPDFYD
jgi:hypothetical protein